MPQYGHESGKQNAEGNSVVALKALVSTANSTDTPLAGGATFTGTGEDLFGYTSLLVTIYADVPSATDGLVFEFSRDNSDWHESDVYTIKAGAFKTYTLQTVERYFRVKYTNGATDQTSFHITTYLNTVPPIPSSHRVGDNISTQDDAELVKAVLTGAAGNNVLVSRDGLLGTYDIFRLVGTGFNGNTIDTNFWTASTSGTGASATQVPGDITLASGTSNSGYATLRTVRRARLVYGYPNSYFGTVSFADTTVALNDRYWGAFTQSGQAPLNGFFFELEPDGTLDIGYADDGSVTKIASGSFNGEFTAYTLVDGALYEFQIIYDISEVKWLINNEVIHTLSTDDFADEPSNDYTLPAAAMTVNQATGVTSAAIQVHASSIFRQGPVLTAPTSRYQSGQTAGLVLKRGAGVLHHMAVSGVSQNSNITLYDNTAASGTILYSTGTMSAQSQPFNVDLSGVAFATGLTMVISGATATVTIVYE